eukprot:scaffold29359_cov32-Phaeocystis_antarctica.AAC.1
MKGTLLLKWLAIFGVLLDNVGAEGVSGPAAAPSAPPSLPPPPPPPPSPPPPSPSLPTPMAYRLAPSGEARCTGTTNLITNSFMQGGAFPSFLTDTSTVPGGGPRAPPHPAPAPQAAAPRA